MIDMNGFLTSHTAGGEVTDRRSTIHALWSQTAAQPRARERRALWAPPKAIGDPISFFGTLHTIV
jgi:hypothetical protein